MAEIDVLLYEARDFMNKNEEYKKMDIGYLLINKEDITKSIVIALKDDEMIEITGKPKTATSRLDWEYNIDEDIFENIENEFEIGFMSTEFHYNIWCCVDDWGLEDIYHPLGLQKYLKYCKEHNINKEALDIETNLDTPDIMKYYDKRTDYIKIENGQVQMPKKIYIESFINTFQNNKEIPIKNQLEKILKNDKDYENYKIECVIVDEKDINNSYAIAMYYDDVAIVKMSEKEVSKIYDASYTYDIGDDSIFISLENENMKIDYMSIEAHYGVWQEIERYYPEDIEHKKGMQEYLKYCKQNHITREVIDKEIKNHETPNVMKYYKEEKTKSKNKDAR